MESFTGLPPNKDMSLVEAFSIKDLLDEANTAIDQVHSNAAKNKERMAAEKEKGSQGDQEGNEKGHHKEHKEGHHRDTIKDMKKDTIWSERKAPGKTPEGSLRDKKRTNHGRAAGERRARLGQGPGKVRARLSIRLKKYSVYYRNIAKTVAAFTIRGWCCLLF